MTISIDLSKKILNELIEHKNWLGGRKQEVSQILFDRYFSYEILSVFKGKPDDQKDFIREDVISKFISTFSDNDIDVKQEIRDKIDLLLDFKKIITRNVLQTIITQLQALLSAENQKTDREEKENFLACIDDVFDTFEDKIADIDVSILHSFATTIMEGIDATGEWAQKSIFIYTSLSLIDVCQDPEKSNLNGRIQDFFSNADVENLKFIFNKYKNDNARRELLNRYQDVFQQRAIEQQPVLDLLYPLAAADVRTQWLITLTTDAPARTFAKLEELNYKLDNKNIIVDTLLTKVQEAPTQDKRNFYIAINKMKCANDAGLRKKLASQIKELLSTDDLNSQQVGYSALKDATHLSETLKRGIARETIENLRLLRPEQASQPDSVRSVLINWNLLEATVKRDYLDFVFDKLIKRGASINDISFGVEILSTTKPRYEDYSQYFDDAFTRAETEGDAQIKSVLVEGLNRIKPIKTTKRSEGYWTKVANLNQNMEDNEK